MYNSGCVKLTNILISVLFYLGFPACASVPFLLYYYWNYTGFIYFVYLFVLLLSGICSIYILKQLKNIFSTITHSHPFVMENTLYLSRCGNACFANFIIYLIKCVLLFTPASLAITVVFLISGLFCYTLMLIFHHAVKHKEENDLTI